jgi:hypothetical protein
MKNIIRTSLSTLTILLISQVSMAQNNKKQQFNRVKTHYCGRFQERIQNRLIFITIHMICNDDYFLTEKTKKSVE